MSYTTQNAEQKTVLALDIRNRADLHAHYMPFIQSGGLFIPSSKPHTLQEAVIVQVNLQEYKKTLPVLGRVVWINPHATATGNQQKKQGVGVQLVGDSAEKVNIVFQRVLGKLIHQPPQIQLY
ncbi:MAG: PilZ domain-containing protein [bacterium]